MDQFLRAHGDGGAESALASAGNAGRVAVGCVSGTPGILAPAWTSEASYENPSPEKGRQLPKVTQVA